jgi:DNA-directed RNA polymerase subunit M/transcription elongation factor TFIIS
MLAEIPRERIVIREMLATICSKHPDWRKLPAEDQNTLIRRIERGCCEALIEECDENGINKVFGDKKFTERYSTICSKVAYNLDINGSVGSRYLIELVMSGEIDPHNIARLPSHLLCPEANHTLRKEIEARQNLKIERKVSRLHTCRRCLKNETTTISYQSRAADESETTSIKCINCDHTWRM